MDVTKFESKCLGFLSSYVPFDGDRIFVAGGFFCRFYHDLPIRDIDIYANDDEAFRKADEELEEAGFEMVHTFQKNNESWPSMIRYVAPDGIQIDLIGFHRPRSLAYIKTFDFWHCQIAMDESSGLVCDSITMECIEQKVIKYNTFKNEPRKVKNNSLVRIKKYEKLGFTIDDEELTAIYFKLLETESKEGVNYPA